MAAVEDPALAEVRVEGAGDRPLEADEAVVPFPPRLRPLRRADPVRFLVRLDRRIERDVEEVLRPEVRRPAVDDAPVDGDELSVIDVRRVHAARLLDEAGPPRPPWVLGVPPPCH